MKSLIDFYEIRVPSVIRIPKILFWLFSSSVLLSLFLTACFVITGFSLSDYLNGKEVVGWIPTDQTPPTFTQEEDPSAFQYVRENAYTTVGWFTFNRSGVTAPDGVHYEMYRCTTAPGVRPICWTKYDWIYILENGPSASVPRITELVVYYDLEVEVQCILDSVTGDQEQKRYLICQDYFILEGQAYVPSSEVTKYPFGTLEPDEAIVEPYTNWYWTGSWD